MWRILKARRQQKYRTICFPKAEPVLPDRFRGLPRIDASRCPEECRACVEACPVQAISRQAGKVRIDLGRCLFCNACEDACPESAIAFTTDYRLSVRRREDLNIEFECLKLAETLDAKARSLFGRSLKLREVCAGGCNACEADVNVLTTVGFDLSRFGIQFVASPRHADGVLITGPVTANMHLALLKTWEAVPSPKLAIAVGACAISGGIYREHSETHGGVEGLIPIDLYIPGCPPHPITILDGLLRLLGRR